MYRCVCCQRVSFVLTESRTAMALNLTIPLFHPTMKLLLLRKRDKVSDALDPKA